MSAYWLILVVPFSVYAGTFITAWMAGRAHDRGYDQGYFDGWQAGRKT